MISPVCTPPCLIAARNAFFSALWSSVSSAPVRPSTGRDGLSAACHRVSSASRLPIPATTDWSSSRAFSGARPRPTRSRKSAREISPAVGAQRVEIGVEAHPAQPSRVEQDQLFAVGEGDPEPEPLGFLHAAAELLRAERPALVAEPQLAGHPQVQAEVRAGLPVAAFGFTPQRLATPVRGGQPPAGQRGGDLAGRVRPADPVVVVVDVTDLAAERADENLTGELDLGEFRHAAQSAPAQPSCG